MSPCPLQWKHGVLTTGPPGKSQRFPVLGLALGSNLARRLKEDARGMHITLLTDAKLERMANVISDKNLSQNDLDTLEWWVKNN